MVYVFVSFINFKYLDEEEMACCVSLILLLLSFVETVL